MVRDVLPDSIAFAGFYSHGEYAPRTYGEPCDLHNQTMTLTVISERG